MAYEVLKKIVSAEDEAETIVAQAKSKLESIISSANERADQNILSAYKSNEDFIAQAANNAYESVKTEKDDIEKNAAAECNSICTKATANKEAAINAVIGKVVGNYGCS